MLKEIRKTEGFSLAELMLAVMILSVVLTGALSVFINTTILTNSSANLTAALAECLSKIEEIRNTEYDDMLSTFNGTTFNLTTPSTGTGSIAVSQIGADVAADLLQIQVDVSWSNKNGRVGGSSLVSYSARR